MSISYVSNPNTVQLTNNISNASMQFPPTCTTFDIFNASSYQVTFATTRGAPDLTIPPFGTVHQWQPATLQFASNKVKWSGLIYYSTGIPLGMDTIPRGIPQQLTIHAYETGYQFAQAGSIAGSSMSGNLGLQVPQSVIAEVSGGFTITFPTGYTTYLYGFDLSIPAPGTSQQSTVKITNALAPDGSLIVYNFVTNGANPLIYRFPTPVQISVPGSAASQFIHANTPVVTTNVHVYYSVY